MLPFLNHRRFVSKFVPLISRSRPNYAPPCNSTGRGLGSLLRRISSSNSSSPIPSSSSSSVSDGDYSDDSIPSILRRVRDRTLPIDEAVRILAATMTTATESDLDAASATATSTATATTNNVDDIGSFANLDRKHQSFCIFLFASETSLPISDPALLFVLSLSSLFLLSSSQDDRAERTGFPEAVFSPGKTPSQIVAILDDMARVVNERILLSNGSDGDDGKTGIKSQKYRSSVASTSILATR